MTRATGRGAFNDGERFLLCGERVVFFGGCCFDLQAGGQFDQGQRILSSWAHAGCGLRPGRVTHPLPGQWQNRALGVHSFSLLRGARTPLLRLAARVVLTYLKSARRSWAPGDQAGSLFHGTIAPLMVSR